MGGFRLWPGELHPLKAPLVPKTRLVLPLPENTRRIDLGFPPPSHAHHNQRVPTRNEELPRPQRYPDDFRNVLRKKHAAGRRLPAAMRVTISANYRCQSMDYPTVPSAGASGDVFAASPGSFSGNRQRPIDGRFLGKSRTVACICTFCSPHRQRLVSRFRRQVVIASKAKQSRKRSNPEGRTTNGLIRRYRSSH